MVAAPSVLGAVEGAPWWVKLTVAVLAIVAPTVLARMWPDRARATRSSEAEDDDEDLQELRTLLIQQVKRTERAEQKAAAAQAEATAAKDEAKHLQAIVDALIARRGEQPTPPQGTRRPES